MKRVLGLLAVAVTALVAATLAAPSLHAEDTPPPAQALAPQQDADGQADGDADEGRIIQIGPEKPRAEARAGRRLLRHELRDRAGVGSRYWIGVAGGAIPPEVRAHLDVPDDLGVFVQSVQPDSPAAAAGVEPMDVLLTLDGEPLTEMRQLADKVNEVGEGAGEFTLELTRKGRIETLAIAPAERPAPPDPAGIPEGWFGGGSFGQEGFGAQGFGTLPGGVSISVAQTGEGPAKITIRRGEESWELEAGDDEAIAALPDDIRPFVERFAAGGPAASDPWSGLFGQGFPGATRPGFGVQGGDPRVPVFGNEVQQRLREMERQVEELRRRFGVPADEAPQEIEPEAEVEELEVPAES